MGEWSADENPYDVLGLSFESTKDELRTKYRRLVLEKHPDKQPGNKKAAEEFIKIQRAYEILTDEKTKEAWDALQRAKDARQAKHAGQSEKRRKMAADLEKREREYEVERHQEKAARNKLNAELARLRKEMADRETERQAAQLRERVAASLSGAATSSGQPASAPEEMRRTLKAYWDPLSGTYTEAQLQEVFSKHGEVEDVVVREPKKKSKCSALIVMSTIEGAAAAANDVSGELDNPLLIVPLAKVPAVGQAAGPHAPPTLFSTPTFPLPSRPPSSQQPTFSTVGHQESGANLYPGATNQPAAGKPVFMAFAGTAPARTGNGQSMNGTSAAHGSTHRKFESDILAKMRQKAERDKQNGRMQGSR